MTGRDLILYILSNNLEDEPVFQNGKFVGFITAAEAAAKMDVGVPTVCVWIAQQQLEGIRIGDRIYVPANSVRPPTDIKE